MTSTIYTTLKIGAGEYGLKVVPVELPNYSCFDDIGYIGTNGWSDPELEYNGNIYNIYDFEDEARALFDEWQKDHLVRDETDDAFYEWMSGNKDDMYEIFSYIKPCKAN